MKYLFFFICFVSLAQTKPHLETKFLDKTPVSQNRLIGFDNFNTKYTLHDNTLYKITNTDTLNYTNLQLGAIQDVNTFNPLKINLFYQDFNTVIVLDNRLAEIFKIDFNSNAYYKNAGHITTGSDNTVWVFNQDTQQLDLFDYKSKTTRLSTIPLQSPVLDIASNYNYCWVLTKRHLYAFNYFGSLVYKIQNDGFKRLSENNGSIFLSNAHSLFYLKKDTQTLTPVDLPELLINRFFVTGETLYIYDNNFLYKYQLKTN